MVTTVLCCIDCYGDDCTVLYRLWWRLYCAVYIVMVTTGLCCIDYGDNCTVLYILLWWRLYCTVLYCTVSTLLIPTFPKSRLILWAGMKQCHWQESIALFYEVLQIFCKYISKKSEVTSPICDTGLCSDTSDFRAVLQQHRVHKKYLTIFGKNVKKCNKQSQITKQSRYRADTRAFRMHFHADHFDPENEGRT